MRSAVDDDVLAKVRQVYLFAELNDKQLKRVTELGQIVQHNAGHVIVNQGHVALGFHLLLDGQADVVLNDEVRRTLGPGDYFGEIAVIDRKPRTASVVARTDVQAWVLAGGAFNELLEREATVAHAVLQGLCTRVRELESAGLAS
jgi:CRP-like cAMP-binding protein